MIEVSTWGSVTAGIFLAALVVVAIYMLYIGLRARRGAAATAASNARFEALLAAAPALAMVVRTDGRVELPARLADWFGLSPAPRYLADLSAGDRGIDAADLAALN